MFNNTQPFTHEEMKNIYELLKNKFKEIHTQTLIPHVGKFQTCNFNSTIWFAYNMPDKQLLLTVTDERSFTFTAKFGIEYVDPDYSIDTKDSYDHLITWKYFDYTTNTELLEMLDKIITIISTIKLIK